MTAQYHIARQGQQTGPWTEQEVRQQIAAGVVTWESLGWRKGMAEWRPLRDLLPPELPPVSESAVASPVVSAASHAAPVSSAGLFAPPAVQKVDKSRSWLWWGISAALLVVVALITVGVYSTRELVRKAGTDEVSNRPLFEDRANHPTRWKRSSFEAVGEAPVPPAGVLERVHYSSPAGKLVAYLTPNPKDAQKHPAIVWAHGGFGGIGSFLWEKSSKRNDQTARAFREAGIVTMMPSWRGENDNPGRFELFYGEVEDLLAAVRHVKTLPYVDPERVYIGGHSTGGTIALLASEASDEFRAAFVFGAMVDGVAVLNDDNGYGNTPYQLGRANRDHRLRSPLRYTAFIRRPTFYFEGEKSNYYVESARQMAERAKAAGVPFEAFILPGDHFDTLHPMTRLIAGKIMADRGKECAITMTEPEASKAYAAAFADSLEAQLIRWRRLSGKDLQQSLAKADKDDVIPHTEEDVKAIKATFVALTKKPLHTPQVIKDMATLIQLRNQIYNEGLLHEFDNQILDELIVWLKKMRKEGEWSNEVRDAFFRIVGVLAQSHEIASSDYVVTLAMSNVEPEHPAWSHSIFAAYNTEHLLTERIMQSFHESLPPKAMAGNLLAASNNLCLDKWEGKHPFNSKKGIELLRPWLTSKDSKEVYLAQNAAVAMAYLDKELRETILPLGYGHPNDRVQLETAWADLMHEGTKGMEHLKAASRNIHTSVRAQGYLKELNHEKAIPQEVKEPTFDTLSRFSSLLQREGELGQKPLSLKVYDQRSLTWPPSGKKGTMWLVKFTYRLEGEEPTKTSYGLYSNDTDANMQSLYNVFEVAPTPEALYLEHCIAEMAEEDEKEGEAEEQERRLKALKALQKANPSVFDQLK